ncbi:hypothetical protein HBA55_24105 [Pseudomaricurvus alkylphenolicus]|jgi:hypothetical protein|uniref:hypothetical protein n=1 Tax=Pseudomaricurvus alkylphenolicus TaxID=1306991 RepID=UPI0014217EF5|nr:hypothetical protein [Pseudomaricurvus alkylphenolicus]NIB42712.1 hypothetical protein [Pseudomaricurvus alkylphenolicus]
MKNILKGVVDGSLFLSCFGALGFSGAIWIYFVAYQMGHLDTLRGNSGAEILVMIPGMIFGFWLYGGRAGDIRFSEESKFEGIRTKDYRVKVITLFCLWIMAYLSSLLIPVMR